MGIGIRAYNERVRARAEKRKSFSHNILIAHETWQGLRDDILSIGNNYFDYNDKIATVEQRVHDVWDELIHAAKILPPASAEQDRLVTLVLETRELGPFARAAQNGTVSQAVLSNGELLWTDLPFLADDLQEFWASELTSLLGSEKESLATFTAKLCASGVCTARLSQCALMMFRETFIKDGSQKSLERSLIPLDDLMAVCLAWLKTANFQLVRQCLHDNGSEGDFSMNQWLLWRKEFGDIYLSHGGHTAVGKAARGCFEEMVGTGRTIGITIPGEKEYLEKLFEALDQELAARGNVGSVGPEDIEINPAWVGDV